MDQGPGTRWAPLAAEGPGCQGQARQPRTPRKNEPELGIQEQGTARSEVHHCGDGGVAIHAQLPASILSFQIRVYTLEFSRASIPRILHRLGSPMETLMLGASG